MGKKGGGRNAFVKNSLVSREDAIGPAEKVKTEAEALKADTTSEAAAPDAHAIPVAGNGQKSSAAAETSQPAVQSAAVPLVHDENETQGQMTQRHKRELKLHKEAMKKLGKKRKDEIEKLDKGVSERHAQELADLQRRQSTAGASSAPPTDVMQLADSLYDTKLSAGAEKAAPHVSKAQKRRQAREQEEAERERRIAEEQAQMGDSERALEERSLAQLLQPLGLAVRDIPADGHCLYRAVGDQLGSHTNDAMEAGDLWAIRAKAAAYMRAHPDQFIPFMAEATDDSAEGSEARFEEYCKEVEKSAAWGGQLELEALSRAYERHITVYSVGMPPVEMGKEFGDDQDGLRLCYLRHAYGLGEHYNSVKAATCTGEDNNSEADDSADL
ncbi:g12889 [Coccomyxa viridis]|uniref:G12889 protein n=1 Tax=Coccomyxa viridis TaxID=1274662 RepID=A0ABP1GBS6_9CHLO